MNGIDVGCLPHDIENIRMKLTGKKANTGHSSWKVGIAMNSASV